MLPNKKTNIPLKVYTSEGVLSDDLKVVLTKWQSDYYTLYNSCSITDNNFMLYVSDVLYNYDICTIDYENVFLNEPITMEEVQYAIQKLKSGKAAGIDRICNEILKQPLFLEPVCAFLKTCFTRGVAPTLWVKSIINPIPKDLSKCIFTPLNYRGISLLCTISKVYSSILSVRINNYCDILNIFVEEQNGFRQNRSCIDHIFSITTIVKNYICDYKHVFCAFIDFKKAFDSINRDLLFYRLLSYNIDGKIFKAIKSLYKDTVPTVKINDYITEYFNVLYGVKQGDNLSPTLFNLFINNLASQIKELHCGIKIGIEQVSILLYADDIVLLSDSEKGLQSMLTYLNKWCMQWCLDINVLKSNIIHFRPRKVPISQFVFKCGTQVIKTIDRYTYLGVILDEHMTFSFCIDSRYTSGSKSLSSIIGKYNVYGNFTYDMYSQLYDACVIPTMLYGAEVFGYIHPSNFEKIQKRALRFFMGVHNSTPIQAMMGDMGWTDIYIKEVLCMLR